MEITTYAPVIIPTLNRYEHFKKCIESLEKCTHSEQTVVYVALDYPPNENYIDGWMKIDSFLSKKEGNNDFKVLHVIRRDRNYGICHDNGNSETLIREIEQRYDRYIFTEDDNEFSPNFLDYMNWGLETYKDDPNIISICGYNEIPIKEDYKHNIFVDTWYSAWGVGHWVEKWNKLSALVKSEDYSRRFIKDCPITIIFKRDIWLASSVIGSIESGRYYWDAIPYRFKEYPLYSVHPVVTMVRNWGQEGSGQHGADQKRHIQQMNMTMQTESYFKTSTSDVLNEANLFGISDVYFKIPLRNRVYEIVNFLYFNVTGKSAGWLVDWYRKTIKKWIRK